MAFYSLEPFGEERDDLRAGVVASAVLNAMGAKKRGSREPWRPSDFLLFSQEAEKADKMDPAVVKAKLVAAFGGRIKRKGRDAG